MQPAENRRIDREADSLGGGLRRRATTCCRTLHAAVRNNRLIADQNSQRRISNMKISRRIGSLLVSGIALLGLSLPATAQAPAKPNILFIMGDDIGWMQPSIYHRGLMVGETPNIDRIGNEGATFMHYYAEQSCTAGRNAFFTGMNPLRTGMIPPQLPGSPTYLRSGTPALARFLRDLGYNTGEVGQNQLRDHTHALLTAHGFPESC